MSHDCPASRPPAPLNDSDVPQVPDGKHIAFGSDESTRELFGAQGQAHAPNSMDSDALRKYGKEMIDFVADYWDSLRDRQPIPDVQPGFIREMLPSDAPVKPEPWSAIFGDLERVILTGNTNWSHPHFFAYYPTANSYPALIGEILSAGLATIGFSWKSGPSCTELEMVVTDWLAKLIGLPDVFLNADEGPGAGMIQCTASDATLVALLSARSRAREHMDGKKLSAQVGEQQVQVSTDDGDKDKSITNRLIVYCSDQAHSGVDKAALLGGVRLRKLQTFPENNYGLEVTVLESAIDEDRRNGLIPFFLLATVGSTPTCAVDDVAGLGAICRANSIWMHVDAAYAGSAAICPEYRYLTNGAELADSFNFNAHKWLLVNFDCSPMWFRDAGEAMRYFNVDPIFLRHEHQNVTADYRHLQIPLGRRFRSLKLWFVLRSLGVEGLQAHIRSMCQLAKQFADQLSTDDRFELVVPVHLGLVCFRLKGDNSRTEQLHQAINDDRRIHLVPAKVDARYFLRLAIGSTKTNADDIRFAFDVIRSLANAID